LIALIGWLQNADSAEPTAEELHHEASKQARNENNSTLLNSQHPHGDAVTIQYGFFQVCLCILAAKSGEAESNQTPHTTSSTMYPNKF
jgi:hypothetical protein